LAAAAEVVLAPPIGKAGNATAMKLIGNLMVALELEALAEGLVLAQKAGVDLKTVMEVVKVADFRSPLLVGNGENILKRDFSTHFSLQLMLKHANLIQRFSETLSSPIPAPRVVQKISKTPLRLVLERKRLSLNQSVGKKSRCRSQNKATPLTRRPGWPCDD
jgi:3-hydroxyisobutyrate dehydrogenase-like beta-hydroxyacid dehydrogenase